RLLVVVVPHRGPGAPLVSPPRRPVAVVEVRERRVPIGVIAGREHRRARIVIQQQPCRFVVSAVTPRDVAGADEQCRRSWRDVRRDGGWGGWGSWARYRRGRKGWCSVLVARRGQQPGNNPSSIDDAGRSRS